MAILNEIPPTAGFGLYLKDFLSIFKYETGALEKDFISYLGANHVRITCSGTAAFYLILEALKESSPKRTVVIPSFVCPLVALAIERAGMKVKICDITDKDFNYRFDGLDAVCAGDKDVLAIVAVHLGGVPVDFDAIAKIAKKYGVFTVEDCAQSLGALYKGKKTGTLGDLAFFSLSRGKGVTTYEGGAIVTNKKEFLPAIDRAIERLVKKDSAGEALLTALLFGYWIFYRPFLFWPVFRLPQRFWKWRNNAVKAADEDFSLDFPVHAMWKGRQAIGHAQFARLDIEIKRQRERAALYIRGLRAIKGISVIEEKDAQATYPYVTVIFNDETRRQRALSTLEASGLGGSFVYALAIADYAYLKGIVADENCANGRLLAKRTVTLSTNSSIKAVAIERALEIIKNS